MYGWRGILPVDNLIKTTFVYDNDFNSKNPFVKYLWFGVFEIFLTIKNVKESHEFLIKLAVGDV